MQTIGNGMIYDSPVVADFTTTSDSYVTVYTWNTEFLQSKVLQFNATTNSLNVTIYGSVDNGVTYDIVAEDEFTVTTSVAVVKRVNEYYTNVRIKVKPATPGSHGTLSTTLAGNSTANLNSVVTIDLDGVGQELMENSLPVVIASDWDLPDTSSGDLAAINAKLPTLVDGKIPVDASVSIDSVDIGDVDIKEFPAGNLGQQAKAASLSVAPATDITDDTYIGDIKFGESLPSGTALLGKVSIDQVTANANEIVVKSITAGPLPDTSASDLSHIHSNLDTLAGTVSSTHLQCDVLDPLPDTSGDDFAGIHNAIDSIDGKISASTINEYNVVLTVVDTEYSQALPANCKGIEFVSRGGYPVRYAFTTGKVAGLASPYFTLKSNCSYENPATLNLSSKTIYFASDNAGDVIELIAWS